MGIIFKNVQWLYNAFDYVFTCVVYYLYIDNCLVNYTISNS